MFHTLLGMVMVGLPLLLLTCWLLSKDQGFIHVG